MEWCLFDFQSCGEALKVGISMQCFGLTAEDEFKLSSCFQNLKMIPFFFEKDLPFPEEDP
jgi:hypothetical protein